MSLSSSSPAKGNIKKVKVEIKRAWSFPPTFRMTQRRPMGTFWMIPLRPMGDHMINYTVDKTHHNVATLRCRKGDHNNSETIRNRLVVRERCFSIPGYFVAPFLWPFVEEMTAKSNDKTLVVTHITSEMKHETDFLKLFQPFGEVTMAKLAHADEKGNFNWGFGFKEDAQKAMNTLNGSGPYGWDKCILKVNWASTVKRFT